MTTKKRRKGYYNKWRKNKLKENPDYWKEQYKKSLKWRKNKLKENPDYWKEQYKKRLIKNPFFHIQRVQKNGKNYYKNYKKAHLEIYRKATKEYIKRNPEKIKAQVIANKLKLKLKRCAKCGINKNLIKHHPDYSKPTYIIALCQKCHRREHSKVLRGII